MQKQTGLLRRGLRRKEERKEREREENGKGPATPARVSSKFRQSSKEEERAPEEDDGLNYKDGRLIWAQKWNLFKECNACHQRLLSRHGTLPW